jgi:hypothetical protein
MASSVARKLSRRSRKLRVADFGSAMNLIPGPVCAPIWGRSQPAVLSSRRRWVCRCGSRRGLLVGLETLLALSKSKNAPFDGRLVSVCTIVHGRTIFEREAGTSRE